MSHFSRRNLRNRSFKNRDLSSANFQGADIRGCNFSGAILSGADFSNARAGLTWQQRLFLGMLIALAGGWVGDAVARLVFTTVGEPPLNPAAPHLQFLYILLSLVGFSPVLMTLVKRSQFRKVIAIVTGILAGAVVGFVCGFYYPDRLQHGLELFYQMRVPDSAAPINQILLDLVDRKVTVALQSTLIGALTVSLCSRYDKTAFKLTVKVASTILSYATAMMWGVIAGAYIHAQAGWAGIFFGLLTLVYLGCTTLALRQVGDEWHHAIGTSFRGAELTGAKFELADLRNTDFSKASGYFR
ncbi:MAG: pentapeptide repeat-containing protein [Aphanocapsa sp. GSE-SYN-MK-11-07L]|nr:pentapeptide repeat-containing protein [Aphanocapsa sp. GSE-SYN-MK-11-07L]